MTIRCRNVTIGPRSPLVVICGPCVIESEAHALEQAALLKTLFNSAGVQLIYKSSYDKANRSSIDSYRGPGLQEGLRILKRVKEEYDLPLLTDIHHPEEAAPVAEVCDILQIPAFLSRQTDLLVAAGKTGAVINIKKGQFMSPYDMEHAKNKVLSTGNERIILTERGNSFGYNNLIADMRNIPLMQQFEVPVCFDASHATQLPGGKGGVSGGERQFIAPLAKAALAVGADLLFIEAHSAPEKAKSDRETVLPLEELKTLLPQLKALYKLSAQERSR